MKKLLTICFLLIVAGNCFGQVVTFQKMYGGISVAGARAVKQTADGGYFVVGQVQNFGAGNNDAYLIKTDSVGNIIWTKTFGGASNEAFNYIQQTTDGGYIISGGSSSFGTGSSDVYLIKIDPYGDTLWTKTFGGIDTDIGGSVLQTIDGGYIISGITGFGAGDFDIYLVKTDSIGNLLWTKTFGGLVYDGGEVIHQTIDGGYIIIGSTASFGSGLYDIFLMKIDINGNLVWAKTFGGVNNETANSAEHTMDGGYIIIGSSDSFSSGDSDVLLIKTDSIGDTLWTKTYGGTGLDGGQSIQQTTDGGYIIAAGTESFGAGNGDIYLIKVDTNGDLLWTRTIGGIDNDGSNSIRQTIDGGYIIAGLTWSFGAGSSNIYLIKTDANGNSGCNQGNTSTIVTTPAIPILNITMSVSSGGIATNTGTILGSGDTTTTLCFSTGIHSAIQNPKSAILISPNPTTGNFTITFPYTINKGVIEIYNVLGKKIFTENIFNVSQKEISINNINAEIYFVKVWDGEKEYCKKLVIE